MKTGQPVTATPVSLPDAAALAALLDAIAAADGGACARPSRSDLPSVFGGVAPSTIIFMDDAHDLHFQSQLHRRVWAENRPTPRT